MNQELFAFIDAQAVAALHLPDDQAWFGKGLGNALAARYVSQISGYAYRDLVEQMTANPPGLPPTGTPVSGASVDLLKPLPLESLKAGSVDAYRDARDRKATAVVYLYITLAGDDKIAPLLEAIRRTHPADNKTLIDLINTTGGVDMTQYLMRR